MYKCFNFFALYCYIKKKFVEFEFCRIMIYLKNVKYINMLTDQFTTVYIQ